MAAPSLPLNALVTLAEAKEELRIGSSTDNDAMVKRLIERASGVAEGICSRPLIYQPTLEAVASVVASTAWSDGAKTVVQPTASRSLYVEATAASAGVVTVVGTNDAGEAVTESFDLSKDKVQYGRRVFKASGITSVTVTGSAGGGNFSVGACVPYTEYHNPIGPVIYSRVYPIVDLAELNEDAGRTFAANTKMVNGTDFFYSKNEGRISKTKAYPGYATPLIDFPEDYYFRYANQLPAFAKAPRSVKLVYSGGFAADPDRSTVDSELKGYVLEVIAILYRRIERKMHGMSSMTTGIGTANVERRDIVSKEIEAGIMGWATRSKTFEEA